MKRSVKIVLCLFLLFSILFSFKQYHYFPVDGDLSVIVLGYHKYQTVMHDPFGMNVLLHDSVYPATNRYFTHITMSAYFKNAPLIFQRFVSPIDSIYYACAFAKTFIHFFIIFLLAWAITGKRKPWDADFLLAASILAPLFQVFGYNISIGVIDHSITYAFFYAQALSLVLLFFVPFFLQWYYGYRIKKNHLLLLSLLAIVLSFNGPLNSPVILLVCPLILLSCFFGNFKLYAGLNLSKRVADSIRKIPAAIMVVFIFACLVSLYSLYIGSHNSENLWATIPLGERFARLPYGLISQLTVKIGAPLLLLMISLNAFLLWRNRSDENARKQLIVLKWIGVLSLLYILALPFGGYRTYRPDIIRMDTILPVTLALFFFYGISTFYILKHFHFERKKMYTLVVLLFSLLFLYADREVRKYNTCEKKALEKISQSTEKIVALDNDCPVMDWFKIKDYNDSDPKTELLLLWGVTKEKKYYYHSNAKDRP